VFLFSISYVRRGLFHGDNMGSNPIGDANIINNLEAFRVIPRKSGDATGTNAEVRSPQPSKTVLYYGSGRAPANTPSNLFTAVAK
jgi:hypothetical protein